MTIDLHLPFEIDITAIFQPKLFYFTLYMSLLGGNWILYHVALPVRIAHHLILSAVLIYWLLKHGLPDTPLLLPLGAMAAVLVLSVVNAIDRRMALEFAWHWMTNWLLFLFLIDALRRHNPGSLFKAQFAAGALLAVSCILQWLAVGGRPAGIFGVINLTGGYLAALMVPALGWYMATSNTRHRKLLIGFMVLATIGIILNHSRGPVLSVLVALAAFGFLTVKANGLLKVSLGIVLMGLCAVIVVGLTSEPQHNTGDVVRMDLWKAGEDMLLDTPTGVGPGLFAQAYHERTIDGDRFTGAHNYYINLGAELGAPGLAAGAAFLLVSLYFLIQEKRTIQQNAVFAGLVGILAHMIGDNYPAQNWSFLLALYAAFLLYDVRLFKRPVPGTVSRIMIYSLVVYSLLFVSWDVAQIHYENALRTHDPVEVDLAVMLDPHNRLYGLEAARLNNPTLAISSDYAITNFGRISY